MLGSFTEPDALSSFRLLIVSAEAPAGGHGSATALVTFIQAAVARRNIQAAVAFLDWLAAGGTTLASCTQASLDEWMAAASLSRRGPTGNFVRWARNQRA